MHACMYIFFSAVYHNDAAMYNVYPISNTIFFVQLFFFDVPKRNLKCNKILFRGMPGAPGEKGPLGPQGRKGEKGYYGCLGNTGEKGFRGDIGADGFAGTPGLPVRRSLLLPRSEMTIILTVLSARDIQVCQEYLEATV